MAYDATAASHRALREIRHQLERHPAVIAARGFPPDAHTTVEATLELAAFDAPPDDYPVETATLTVRWFAGETADQRPTFSMHYSDDSGLDCGWHHEPNPHVEGWGHHQWRTAAADEYTYESYSIGTTVPGRVTWEILSILPERVASLHASR